MKTYFIHRDDTYEFYTKEALPEDLKKELKDSLVVKCFHQHLDNIIDLTSSFDVEQYEEEVSLYLEGYKYFFQINKWDNNGVNRTYNEQDLDCEVVEKILQNKGYTEDKRHFSELKILRNALSS